MADLLTKVQNALEHEEADMGGAIQAYEEVIDSPNLSEDGVRAKEQAVYRLGGIYKNKGLFDELLTLTKSLLPKF